MLTLPKSFTLFILALFVMGVVGTACQSTHGTEAHRFTKNGWLAYQSGRYEEALKLARKMIKSKYPNPFYWAVFILHEEG